jgi:hypothetical protein
VEGGPEAADGIFTLDNKCFGLEERESEVWSILDGARALGTVRALPQTDERGVRFAVDVPGETETEDVPTPDWKAAVEYVIDRST